jgi:hypothetical protein
MEDDKDKVEVLAPEVDFGSRTGDVLGDMPQNAPRKPNSVSHERDEGVAYQVKTLASYGLSKGSIAIACQISQYILDKYYMEEFLTGISNMQKRIAALAFQAAEEGSVPMIMYLAKTKLGWVESSTVEHVGEVRAVVTNKPLSKEEFIARYLDAPADKKDEDL